VDDNSPDGTAEVVRQYTKQNPNVSLLERNGPRGLGLAYIDGFHHALAGGYDLVIMMDADLSHDPDRIPAMIEATAQANLVIGSRYLQGVNVINWQLSRLIISILANKYTRLVTGLPVNDCTSGFKCLRRSVLEDVPLERISSTGYSFQIELHYRAWKRGFQLIEIPIIFYERKGGGVESVKRNYLRDGF